MAWIALLAAGLCEVLGVLTLKRLTKTRDALSISAFVLVYGASFSLLAYAMTDISMGVAYAVWTGIGAVGSTLLGMLAFGESRDRLRLASMGLIVASTIGLKWISH